MATQITTLTAGYILIQAGHGTPNHLAPKGSQFTDIDTAKLYFNKDGLSDWEENVDTTNSGATISVNTFSSFSSSTIGQGSVIATTSSDNLTFSGVNLSILVDNTNKILTLSAATSSNGTTFTGGTVNGFTNFTNGLSATTISATTFYGNGSNLTGISTQDTYLTGGTYSNGTATFTNNTGGTFTVSGFKTSEVFVTGGTYSNSTGITTFTNNTGGTFTVSGYFKPTDDVYTTGMTFNASNYNLSITRNDGTSFTQSLAILASDMTITGGTYSSSTGVATFTNNTGGTFSVSGFLTGMTDTYTTGFTYSNNTLTLKRNASQPDLSVMINSMTGLTVNGTISTTTISATTYQNLPTSTDIRVTGGTYSNGTTTFTNNTGGTFTVTGFKTSDLVVTGGTYNSGSILFTNNTGGTFTVSGLYTGYTAPVDVTVTGGTYDTNSGIATFSNNTGGTFTLTGFKTSDLVVTGGTYSNGSATFTNNTGGTFTVSGFKNNDLVVTGGTYNNSTGVTTFTNNTGGTFTVNGYYTGYTLTSSEINSVLGYTPLSAYTDTIVTGGTYSNGTTTFTNNTGGTFTVSGFKTDDLVVTGGTYNNGSILFTNNTGGTFNVTGLYTGYTVPIDITVTGGTYSSGTATFTNNTGGTFTVSGFKTDDIYTTGMTFNASNYNLSITRNDGTSFTQNLAVLASDMTITGGTYNANSGVATFTNNTGGTFTVNGFLTGMTDTYTTGLTFSNNVLTLKQTNNQADLDILINNLSGLTVNGSLSATTFYGNGSNLTGLVTQDTVVTGGTYNAGTATFTNNTGGTFTVTGFNTGSSSGLTASDYVVQGYLAASQTITSNLDTILQFSDDYDPQNWWDASSYRFTPTIAGYYQITLQVLIQAGTVTNSQYNTQIRKNGSNQEAIWQNQITTSTGVSQGNSKTIYMNGTTDYIDFTVYQGNPGSVDVFGSSQKSQTFFHAHLLTGLNSSSFTASNLGAGTGIFAQKSGVDFQFKSLTSTGGTVTLTNNATTVNLEVVPASNFTGGTVNGATNFTNGLTSNTFSATTYFNLPTDVRVTGGTYSSGTATFTNNTGGTFTVTGFNTGTSSTDTYVTGSTYSNNTFTFTNNTGGTFNVLFNTVTGLTSTGTISSSILSATTYLNLPTDIRVTGGTYSSGTATFTNNTGGTFTVTGFSTGGSSTTFTGGTVTGATNFTGGLVANTISATTYQNLPIDIRVTGGTYSSGTATFTNNTGGTFTVTGFSTGGSATFNGGTVTGATYFTGGVSANTLTASGTGQNILTVIGSGNSTTSPIFSVVGSQGELFSVSDSLTGSLFSVNDISGLPIVEVFSDNTVLIGSYQAPSLNTTKKLSLTAGTNTVYSIPTSTYTGAFIDYTVISSGSTGARAGTIMSIWSGTTAQYTDVSTNDIGTTAGITFSVSVVGSNAVLSTSATTAGWTLKTIIRSI